MELTIERKLTIEQLRQAIREYRQTIHDLEGSPSDQFLAKITALDRMIAVIAVDPRKGKSWN